MSSKVIRFFLFFIIAIAFGSSAYGSDSVTLTLNDSGSHVSLQQGQLLEVSLCRHPGTVWEVLLGADSILTQEGAQLCIPVSSCSSSGYGYGDTICTFSFRATEPGQTTLILGNPGPTPTSPVVLFMAKVMVVAVVPTMTEWGMILFVIIAGVVSVSYLRKRQARG